MKVDSIEFVFEDVSEDESEGVVAATSDVGGEEDDEVDEDQAEFDEEEEDLSQRVGELCCPACGAVWSVCGGGQAEMIAKPDCPHLRFTFAEYANDFEFPTRYTKADLLRDVEPALRSLPELLGEGEEIEDALHSNAVNSELWDEVVSPDVDTVFMYTHDFIACGPGSYTVIFGAQITLAGAEATPAEREV